VDENIVVRINAPIALWPLATEATRYAIQNYSQFNYLETGKTKGRLVRTNGYFFYVWKTKTGYSVGHWEEPKDG
jgi:hypothetical protein